MRSSDRVYFYYFYYVNGKIKDKIYKCGLKHFACWSNDLTLGRVGMPIESFDLIPSSSPKNEISSHLSGIDKELNLLTRLLRDVKPTHAFVTKIPDIMKGQEDRPVNTVDGEVLEGQVAIDEAIRSYNDFYIKKGLSQKVARRCVGVIWIQPSNISNEQLQAIIDCVASINNHKIALRQKVTALPTRQARFTALREARPGIMTVHLYRTVKCLVSENIRSVGLSWERKQLLSKLNIKTKQQLLERIEAEASTLNGMAALPLRQLLDSISPIVPSQLRLRRDVRVQPVANIMGDTIQTITAVMPIILLQNTPPTLAPIKVFDASVRRKKRSDSVETEILGTFNGSQIERRY
ncbi:DNA replication terminus site-binding protein [Gilvimarinus agarilyticus]|uniref:DNA replication terminus site-binding protein n=1 Tax=Gilvimarinus sp. 2_MG-2023 TaxID=3062666 RepID=UPI001C0A10B8|nr:DNA replication terminus site-binding protein [Gilvimarinus sp. 2_MG-2023]MBU2886404.1 DNA replication terminus site-binding protein [Gilvimarinus agarilyticus]MDO6571083.1 DNA replication terminus site-binding protein [Gilvimarinus sp. 2_MG-2023]